MCEKNPNFRNGASGGGGIDVHPTSTPTSLSSDLIIITKLLLYLLILFHIFLIQLEEEPEKQPLVKGQKKNPHSGRILVSRISKSLEKTSKLQSYDEPEERKVVALSGI